VEAAGNQIKINEELASNLEVSVVDEKNSSMTRYLDVKKGEHKILITMNFQ
jgi:hypothetical protein